MLLKLAMFMPLAIFATITLALATLVFWPEKVIGVSETAIENSLESEVPLKDPEATCSKQDDGFACEVSREGRASNAYLVSFDGGCWTARRPGGGGRAVRRGKAPEGCVGLTDYLPFP